MVDVRQEEASVAMDEETGDGRTIRHPLVCKYLREDWLRDPSHMYATVSEFSRMRSCSNLLSSVVFSMMNKVSVQVANRIHKHARINNELLFRVQQNIEQTHSFTEVFMNNINKYIK